MLRVYGEELSPDRQSCYTEAMDPEPLFESLRFALIGAEVGHVWRGYGSALFLEIGRLRPGKLRRDKPPGNPQGDFTLMIQWAWRIEEATSIVCGSDSEQELWQPTFDLLVGARVANIELFGCLPEISVELTNGMFVTSFMNSEGDPDWAILDRRDPGPTSSLSVRQGRLHVEDAQAHEASSPV